MIGAAWARRALHAVHADQKGNLRSSVYVTWISGTEVSPRQLLLFGRTFWRGV
jgi:hypothetical protein